MGNKHTSETLIHNDSDQLDIHVTIILSTDESNPRSQKLRSKIFKEMI